MLPAAPAPAAPAPAAPQKTIVFAAASLKEALDAVNARYRTDTGLTVVVSYAATSTLAKQIAAGAPADLFISADLRWMDYLAQRRLIDPASRIDLLGNSLVLIAPKSSTVKLAIFPGFALAQRLGGGRLAIADPDSVPAGLYAKAALESLGVWDAVRTRLAPAQNVRAALLLVARGEAPLGIVYATDARVEPAVRTVAAFPPGSHPPIVYPMALTARATGRWPAAFAAYLRGPQAGPIFARQGFTVLAK